MTKSPKKSKSTSVKIPKSVEKLLQQRLEAETQRSKERFEKQKEAVEGHFSDLRERYAAEIKKSGMEFPQDEITKQMEKGLAGNWATDPKFQAFLEQYLLPIREMMLKAGYDRADFQKRLLDLLGFDAADWSPFGLGSGVYRGHLERFGPDA
jgi:hypothetical protein